LVAGEAAGVVPAGAFAFCVAPVFACPCAGDAAGEAAGDAGGDVAGEACGEGCVSPEVVCKTERCPVIPGSESKIAINMKAAAAPIVILANIVCVPRGPKAVLETLLEKSAPASALPGCKSTATMSTTHASKNRMYKIVIN
jgi:hypothetical protein